MGSLGIHTKYERDPDRVVAELVPELSARGRRALIARCRWVHLRPGQRLSRVYDVREGPQRYFVLEGQIGVLASAPREREDVPLKLTEGLSKVERRYRAVFTSGDSFSDTFFAERSATDALDCVATMETMLGRIAESDFERLAFAEPVWAAQVVGRNAEARARYRDSLDPAVQVVQDFFVHQNYSIASTARVIDLDACIGCDGCERACADRHGVTRLARKGPTLGRLSFPITCRTCVDSRCLPACGFDALTMKESELVIDKMKCVGCRACYDACPNSVITMIETPYTVDDFPKPMPDTDLSGRTNVEGLYLVGEAAGAALIKVASNAGVAAAESVIEELAGTASPEGVHDVIIAGAGPSGLAASLTCLEAGLDFKVFDKALFAKTIHEYPREKVVMAEPAHIPKYGSLWLENTTKEGMIAKWAEIIETTGLQINGYEPVESVQKGEDGVFDVVTPKGAYRARRVILATGNRGTPRKLGVDGEAEPRVLYTLTDPEPFDGKRTLVVGGGDSAVEAAMTLADFGATVALSYRRDKFGRIKGGNRTRLAEYEADGRVRVVLESTVKALEDGAVVLKTKNGDLRLDNDTVFALLGAEPPIPFFEAAGIDILQPGSEEMARLASTRGTRFFANKCDHCAGHHDQACVQACPTGAIFEVAPRSIFLEPASATGGLRFKTEPFIEGIDPPRSKLRRVAGVVALVALVLTVLVGLECFARSVMPERSLTHRVHVALGIDDPITFDAGAGLGLWLGIIGMSLMLLASLYPLSSRLGWARRWAKTKFWLAAHVAAGLLGPCFITYHTMLKLDRWPSLAFWAMWLVVASGMIGRFVYTAMRRRTGLAALEGQALAERRKKLIDQVQSGQGLTQLIEVDEMLDLKKDVSVPPIVAPFYVLGLGVWHWARRTKLRWVELRSVTDAFLREQALRDLRAADRNARRRVVSATLERSASIWRWIHLGITVAMFVVAIGHIAVAMLYRA
ncbi:MAG: NAD(P)-binding domain-containing protein [Deltaproteobacteria bacterium]